MKWIIGVSILATALGWAGTTTMAVHPATITPDEAMLKYFPQETQGIAFIDVAGLRDAPLVQDFLSSGQFQLPPKDFQEIIDKTGFDVRRDLDSLVVGNIDARDRLIVVNAHYDRFKAEQFVKDSGKNSEAYLGRNIFALGDLSVTFLDNLALVGTDRAVKGAIDRITYPGAVQLGSELLDAIKTIEAGNQVWAVSSSSQQALLPPGIPESTPAVQFLKSFRGGKYQMRVDRDIHARGTANFLDAQTAGDLAAMARGLIAGAKLQIAKQQPEFLRVLDGIQISSSGSTVLAQIDEPGDLLKKLQTVRTQPLLRQ